MGKIGKTGKRSCCDKESVSKGAWSLEEDQILTNYIKIHGEGKWRSVAQNAGLKRYGKSCRLRWLNYLRPGIKRGDIAADEEDLIVRLHRLLGNRWALIAGRLPGRTDNEIKNYWNTILVKKLQGQELTPSVRPLKIDEKKPIEDFAPCTPSGIKTMAYHSPKEGKNLINNICDGHIQSPTTPIEDDSLNFFMDIDVDKVLFQDVFNSDFLQIHHDKMLKMGNMIDENEVDLSSSSCSHSANEVALENGIKNDSLEPTLDVELKRVTSFLDLEDEWELFCRREES